MTPRRPPKMSPEERKMLIGEIIAASGALGFFPKGVNEAPKEKTVQPSLKK